MGKRDKEINLGLPDEVAALVEAQDINQQEAIRNAIKKTYGDVDPGENIDARIAQIDSRLADIEDEIEDHRHAIGDLQSEKEQLQSERDELAEERPEIVEKVTQEPIEDAFGRVVGILDEQDQIYSGHPVVEQAAEEHTDGDAEEFLHQLWQERDDVEKDEIHVVGRVHVKDDW